MLKYFNVNILIIKKKLLYRADRALATNQLHSIRSFSGVVVLSTFSLMNISCHLIIIDSP